VRSVGVREFRDQATTLIASGETIVVERHGEPVGFFVPITAKDRVAGRAALGRLGELLADVTERAGVDEEDVAQEVAGRRPRRR
jgi:antitoxin (DNA-binding transcriptional repressor) of toxin-antitoxin stability system